MPELDCIMLKKKINMGTGLKAEQRSHMKMLTIMCHRTNGHLEKENFNSDGHEGTFAFLLSCLY